jgi:putative Holliday junction resolvase
MSSNTTVLALDVGERRVGAATASMDARLATPLATLDRQQSEDIYSSILRLAKEHQAVVIVVGLPRGLQGQETDQTKLVRIFASKLQKLAPELTVVMQDEAGTSVQAEELLRLRNKAYTKADIDAEAACLILRDYLHTSLEQTA